MLYGVDLMQYILSDGLTGASCFNVILILKPKEQ